MKDSNAKTAKTVIRPQPGPQEAFLASSADWVIYGGAAGGGKSFALLLETLRHINNPGFRAVIFRRTTKQITGGGGLWDTAGKIYPSMGGKPNQSSLEYTFPSGAKVKFTHLEHEKDKYSHDGAQYAFCGFDELIHFSKTQVFYLLSRLRSMSGVRPYIRTSCNPDSGSWVKEFIQWWIGPDGLPIKERIGKIRWFYRNGDEVMWYDSRKEAEEAHPNNDGDPPMSVTFVPAKLTDNAILCDIDKGYKGKLKQLSYIERSRLLDGNWNTSASDGLFRKEWFPLPVKPTDLPGKWKRKVRAWDLAATEQKDNNDPDYTAGVLMGEDESGRKWVLDVVRRRVSPQKVKTLVQETAKEDGADVLIIVEQEPGSAGKIVASDFKDLLKGYSVKIDRPDASTGDKVTRAYPFSAACERGEVWLVDDHWTKDYLSELIQFPKKGVHDDMLDASAMAWRHLTKRVILV